MDPIEESNRTSREYWDIDRIYTYQDKGVWYTFHSPDGVGKIFHPDMGTAKKETGIRSVVHLLGVPLDI